MAVDAIGSAVGSGVGQIQNRGLQVEDFLKLFLAQLSFQDPLNPVDNKDFLAQLAQFTNIQQVQVLSDNIQGLLSVQSTTQALGLLGRSVQVTQNNTTTVGQVTAIMFSNGQPLLTLKASDGSFIQGITPTQITLVQ